MTKKIITIAIFASLFISACKDAPEQETIETTSQELVEKANDQIVKSSLNNKEGQILDMTFNNTTNRVKVSLNGGEQIELVGQKPASGIWYKNDHYELRGKGENVELTKDGKVIFKN